MIETSTLLKLIAKPAIKESIPLFKKLKDNVSHFINDGFLDYFLTSLEKYKETKTLLHRQPTNFYDIYYPAKLKLNNTIIDTDSVKHLFKENNCITVIGDAGSGKSTLVKHLFITSFIEAFKAPIFIALRDLNLHNSNLEVFLKEELLENKLSPNDNHLENLLKSGEFLFFLDGYDEIKSDNKHEITTHIEKFIDKYPKNNFILTSRPYSNIEYFKNFINYKISNLSVQDRINFVQQQLKNDPDTRLSNKIVESIEEVKHNYINSFLENPLLLTLYIMTYSKNSSIPSNKYVFYRRVFDVLYAEHDSATKVGFEREIKTELDQESLEDILKTFSFLSYFDSHFDFRKDYIFDRLNTIKEKNTELKFKNNDFIQDMKLSIGLWVEDSGLYAFSHRSMQEYFASVFVSKISDSKNKRSVYQKIVQISTNPEFDIKNFLSLCYEMDEEFFIRYYTLPIIKEIKKLFINKDLELRLDFPFFGEGFSMHISEEDNGKKVYSWSGMATSELVLLMETCITPDVYYNKFFNDLIEKFFTNFNHNSFSKYLTLSKKEKDDRSKRESYTLNKNRTTQNYFDFLNEVGVVMQLENIVEELNTMENIYINKLKIKKTVEDNFIDMI